MDGAGRLWLLASFFQVFLLTCEKPLNPVEVELLFSPFKGPHADRVTCRATSNHQVYSEAPDHSASANCQVSLRLVEDPTGYNITLTGDSGDAVETKTFHFTPVSLSSIRVHSTTTSVALSWELDGQRSLSAMSLYNAHTQAVTRVMDIGSSEVKSQYTVRGLHPGTHFRLKAVVTTFFKDLSISVKQSLYIGAETARCPHNWLANGRSCYTVRRAGLTWREAQRSCGDLAAGSHLADLKTLEELLFISSHMLRHNNLLMLWTGLSDQQKEGQPLWTDGSVHNLTDNVMSLLPANQTDCFALQRNATGPGYFLTPFFCNIALPFICQYQVPLLPPSFSFDLVQVAEQQYREETNGELFRGERIEGRLAYRTESRSVAKKVVEVPISLSSRGVTVAGPPSPQNITVSAVTTDHIQVHWTLPVALFDVGWTFLVRYMDMSNDQTMTRTVGMTKISRISETNPLRSYTAAIGGLESHRKYRIEVSTVTKHGIESCEQAAVVVQTDPLPIQVAVPLSVGTNSAQLHVQRPQLSVIDGVKVCMCPVACNKVCKGSCGYLCDWYPLPAGVHVLTLQNLSPGSEYQLGVYSTSHQQTGPPYYTTRIKTGLAPPNQVREGVVTDSSIELLWDPAQGDSHGYEVMCLNCEQPHRVQKVSSQNAVFSSLIPGTRFHFVLRTEKESFTDSYPVTINITAVPEVPQEVVLSGQVVTSVFVTWRPPPGGVKGYKIVFGLLSADRRLWVEQLVQGTSYEITDLIPGSDYCVSVQSVLGLDASRAIHREFSTKPSGLCPLRLADVTSSSFSVSWDSAYGEFDFHRVTVTNTSVTNTLVIPKKERVAVVTGLVEGCTYNVSVERADVVNVSPGTQYAVTVGAASASSSNISPGVSRMINTNESALEGEAVGSNGILLSWTMPPDSNNVDGYVIRYKEVCPYPDSTFTEVTKYLDIPETLLTDFTPGSTYHIEVAAISSAGVGAFSKSLYIKTAESAPGLVTNLTAFAQNHSFVVVTWFLPRRINGLITKFAVKAKHARTGQTVRTLEVNAEDIMTVALPHCNDAADILSKATLSPLEITASSPPITLSAVPSAASWSVPISVGVDQLRPYTAYLFEVSAFTSDGEGQIASTMVRMPESGYLYENSTGDMQFTFAGLTPYTRYTLEVRAKAAGEVGPSVQAEVITPAEAPSVVQDLRAEAEDSVSIRVSWRSPAKPNGLITRYRLQVLVDDVLLQDITLTADVNTTSLNEDEMIPAGVHNRRKRTAELSLVTSPLTFTATRSDHALPSSVTASSSTDSSDQLANTKSQLTFNSTISHLPASTTDYSSASHSTNFQSADPAVSGTAVFSPTSLPATTLPPWLTRQSQSGGESSLSPSLALTPGHHLSSTHGASIAGHFSTRSAAVSGNTVGGVTVREEVLDVLAETLSYLVSELNPFTEYTFRVTASTVVGEGPAKDITEKTREQVPSSVLDVSYQNISSTSILVAWVPPLYPNGRITHYTVYGLNLKSNQALKWMTNSTSILITDLDKYTGYKLRVAASTAVGESSLSEEDDIFVFTLEDEPDSPPEDLTVEDISPFTATLSWSPPEKANGVIQHYEVLYENESFSAMANTSSNRITLTNLRPFSYYNVSVRVFTRYGHGNQTSDTLYLLSGEGVPGSPPYDLKFESVSPSEVNVTWEPPLFPNGIISHYSLELWNSSHYLNLTSQTNYIHITHLRKYAHYRVAVQAHTRVGPGNYSSEPLNITTLEDAPDTPPQFLHARKLSDYEVELSWQPPLEANSHILYYIVRVWNESTELLQNVTGTSVIINVDSESPYNASVSSWTRLGDGGVLIYISFTTAHTEPFDPPQNVTIANATASSITLFWHPPAEPNGIIIHYTVYYSDNNSVTGQRVPVTELANLSSPDSTYTHTVSGLIGGTNYTVWMTSSTAQGDGGVQSEPQTVFLPEYVPNDSVRNLTAQIFSSTAIIVSWDPPLEPNGRPYYLLTLQEAGIPPDVSNQGAPVVNKTTKHTTTDTVFLFTKLRKFFPYVLTVTPATGAGPANNHTRIMYLRTDDDIPSSAPLLVSTRNLSSSSIEVVWQRPLEANGEIIEFLLTLFGPGGSNTSHTSTTSSILTNLHPYTAYNLSITAATRKGSGPYLLLQLHTDEGVPMSPPRNLTIYNHSAVSVWLSWEPPLEPNGVVIQYGFRIQDLITHTVTHRNSSGPSTMEYLSGFRPHSSYEISVYSYTRVGHGSQFSSPVTFTTSESVSDAVGNLTCSGVSWDSIQLSWDLPDHPNGQIRFYEVQLEVEGQSYVHSTDTAEYTVSGLSPDQEYSLTVAAVNSAGPGDLANCTASTLSESVPAAPRSLTITHTTANSVTLHWAPPLYIPGVLKEFHVVAQLLSTVCEPSGNATAHLAQEEKLSPDCVDLEVTSSLNASDGANANRTVTVQSLAKYRYYRFKVAAVTNAGVGEYTRWTYVRTLAGSPDAPPRGLNVTASSSGFRIAWEAPAILSGPTSYLVQVDGPNVSISTIRAPEELRTIVVTNLTAFTRYFVTVTAFTGPLQHAARDGKAIGPIEYQTLEEQPKDPPKNVVISIIPEEVTRVKVTFTPPDEPNGNITAYFVYIFERDKLVKNVSLNITEREQNTMTAVIEGLKGGHNYSIQISAKNGAGRSPPSPHVQIMTDIKAPAKPTQRPQAVLSHGGVAMVTHRSITIRMPACFYSDDNGPIKKIQVIVAESGVKDIQNVTNWRSAYFDHPAPYLTDKGFPNPPCSSGDRSLRIRGALGVSGDKQSVVRSNHYAAGTYVIGENDDCVKENSSNHLCNGPLKPNTVYVFKFRATNIRGQSTDSDFSEHIKTAVDGLLTREEQIILGVLLSFFLAVLLIIIICGSVKIHQRKKEGGTYSPREAEIIETKCKLDQLIAVADLELKQEKINRLLSYRKSLKPINKKTFLQHVEDLCANDNAKFQEEFGELPKLLQDLGTTDADLPWNKSKNRFPNIKPYNNNRVKLLSEPGSAGSDYINASFVSGYLCPNEFIATQGPLPGTVADFWRMIWETGTRTIAMLTQCYEKGRIRCHKYWPEDNKPMSVFSDILISKVSEEVLPDWTVRTLKVEKHGHYILVRHFNYTSWPEHGVPESCSTFIKFVKAVRMHRHENTTIAVHCSAGVGRTGVFIALDHLIQHIRDHDFVDIYGLVAELRSERMCMVQNLAQYIFLHQSTLELLNNKGNSQSIWFVSYSALEKMDSLDAMEGDVELEWEETTM
ncbi:Phosphatidylinositol phosphatase PTPRQ [Takifugu flavidus]|uniref:Phosphatidylinositol phosphatase PTPRQ n=1 Tax=Takifugu flavidus TaxID=433684 RepID=A0A5C6PDN5_9TELE|nr:Phosphatidylinositol phosphatase PTPRQ [Takifugu flavidus]